METNNKPNYSYQNKTAKKVLKNALSKKYAASVTAATPGAGKTTISQMCIRTYLQKNPSAQVVVLTEGQSILKNQYISELENSHIEIDFTYGEFGSDAQVQVGLPQSINRLKCNTIDLLVIDEAHNFYFAPTVQRILREYNVSHQILMTGSPSEFTYRNAQRKTTNQKPYAIEFLSVEDLKGNGVFAGVDMDVFRTADRKKPHQTIKDLMIHTKKERYDTTKMMIACPTVQYAKSVRDYLNTKGRNAVVSTSDTDKDNKSIESFKNGEFDVLIVVNKGILGFNDSNITFLVDLKSSGNLDSSNQLFSRVLRTHPDGLRKSYIRASTGVKDFNNQVFMLHKITALMERHVFKNYNGKNLSIEIR